MMRLFWTRFIVTLAVTLFTVTSPAASVDGAEIHWSSSGTGKQTLIFVHGWTCDETAWSAQVPVFSRDYRVITLDLPGHGRSGSPASGKFSMVLFAGAIEAVRKEAGVERAVLVGHSMGVPVIREYALMFPERAVALVLVDGGGVTPDQESPFTELPDFTGANGLKTREEFIRGMFTPATPAAVQERVLKMMLSAPERTATGAFNALFDRSQWHSDPVTLPVLGIYAEQSFSANPDLLKSVFPRLEFHQIQGTGHFLMMEKPDVFNKLLAGFLKKIY